MLKRLSLALVAAIALLRPALATPPEEGMWLPMNISRLNYEDMKKMGLKLTAEELYSLNNSSVKDAVVHFGGFCSGEIISNQGLVLTNHHCGYEAIQSHSTVADNILQNGFWAKSIDQEKPVPGLFVRFLVRMEDVSQRVLGQIGDNFATEQERNQKAQAAMAEIRKEATKDGFEAEVKEFFNGNEYYLLVYERYTDVRLVGAPPESVGKFGGDTDNWMWPRHTGDFSMFRIYANKDNKPAEYSKENVPFKPKHFFPVNIAGVQPGDFSMIFGYPGTTNRYVTSFGVKMALDISDPTIVAIRAKKLELMKQDMDKDPKVRIQYASKHAQIANYWKFYIGEQQGLRRLNVVGKKQEEEAAYTQFVNADNGRKARMGNVLKDLQDGYSRMRQYELSRQYLREAILGQGLDILQMAAIGSALKPALEAKPFNQGDVDKIVAQMKPEVEGAFKDYNLPTDKKIFEAMMRMYSTNVPKDQQPVYFKHQVTKYNAMFDKMTDDVYAKSVFATADRLNAFLAKPDLKKLNADPAFNLYNAFRTSATELSQSKVAPIQADIARGNRLYVEGTMKMLDGKKKLYPNANSTMRMTYGTVQDYKSRDAVRYAHMTTIDGIMEKEDSTNPEFYVPKRLKELYKLKDYGQYGENGTLPVGFLTTNDITGGNSGSPVLNARGELIGTAFDGNWEAMSGNIAFEPALQRTIICDIRYVLWCIDKLGGAPNLIKEMKLVTTPVERGEQARATATPVTQPGQGNATPPPTAPKPKGVKGGKAPMATPAPAAPMPVKAKAK